MRFRRLGYEPPYEDMKLLIVDETSMTVSIGYFWPDYGFVEEQEYMKVAGTHWMPLDEFRDFIKDMLK